MDLVGLSLIITLLEPIQNCNLRLNIRISKNASLCLFPFYSIKISNVFKHSFRKSQTTAGAELSYIYFVYVYIYTYYTITVFI